MRIILIAALGLTLPSCAHVIDTRQQLTEPTGWCKDLPFPLELPYADGGTMVRGRRLPLEQPVSEWSYFDHNGKLVLIEEEIPEKEVFFTAYYPEGKKQFEGGYVASPHGYLPQGTWRFYHPNGQLAARAMLERGALTDKTQWDTDGKIVAWNMDPVVFELRPMRPVQPLVPEYPEVALTHGVQGSSCSLVCADDNGKVAGVFPLSYSASVFGASAGEAINQSVYVPRVIAGATYPSCQRIIVGYAVR
jgi:hypothetical protein